MRVDAKDRRTIWLAADGETVEVIDQRRLPHAFETLRLSTPEEAAAAIGEMVVRGAPLIGVAGGYGMALAARADPSDAGLARAAELIGQARPTAVNLRWAVERMQRVLGRLSPGDRAGAAYREAAAMAEE